MALDFSTSGGRDVTSGGESDSDVDAALVVDAGESFSLPARDAPPPLNAAAMSQAKKKNVMANFRPSKSLPKEADVVAETCGQIGEDGARQRVEACAQDGTTSLVLQFYKLRTLVPEVFSLANLTELDLHHNKLSLIPPEISHLTNLEKMDLSNNRLTTLPSSFGQITRMQDLILTHNQLTSLPEQLGNCTDLRKLVLDFNQLKKLPSLDNLNQMKQVRSAENPLTQLPCIGLLSKLKEFELIVDNAPAFQKELATRFPAGPAGTVTWNTLWPDQIQPGIFLGSVRTVQNVKVYKDLNVQGVLTCGRNLKVVIGDGMDHECITVEDIEEQNLLPSFEQASDFIHRVRQGGGGVLVHCFAGLSRSVSFLTGYLMRFQHMSLDAALTLIRSKRPRIRPNPGFMVQLKDYERHLTQCARTGSCTCPFGEQNKNPSTPVTGQSKPPSSFPLPERTSTPLVTKRVVNSARGSLEMQGKGPIMQVMSSGNQKTSTKPNIGLKAKGLDYDMLDETNMLDSSSGDDPEDDVPTTVEAESGHTGLLHCNISGVPVCLEDSGNESPSSDDDDDE